MGQKWYIDGSYWGKSLNCHVEVNLKKNKSLKFAAVPPKKEIHQWTTRQSPLWCRMSWIAGTHSAQWSKGVRKKVIGIKWQLFGCTSSGRPGMILPFSFWFFKCNVCSAEKLTKRSTVLLMRLVSFSVEQTLLQNCFRISI